MNANILQLPAGRDPLLEQTVLPKQEELRVKAVPMKEILVKAVSMKRIPIKSVPIKVPK